MKAKRWLCLLLCILICCSACGCGSEPEPEPEPESESQIVVTKLTQAEAEKIAKQEIVNRCCEATGTTKIGIASYNVVKAWYYDYEEPFAGWTIEAKGTFYPTDSYGEYRSKYKFEAIIVVGNDGRVQALGGTEFSCHRA